MWNTCLLRKKCFNQVCLQIALRWLQFYFCIMIVIVLEYTQHILQCTISFLKINWVLYLQMSHFEAGTLIFLHSVCSSKGWKHITLLSYTNHVSSGHETLQKKASTVLGHLWNMKAWYTASRCGARKPMGIFTKLQLKPCFCVQESWSHTDLNTWLK